MAAPRIICRTQAELDAAMVELLKRPRACHLLVLHDSHCEPDRCSCHPHYVIEDLTVDTFTAGQRAEREWRASKRAS